MSFSIPGYSLVMLNNVFTASNGVFMKKKLDSKEYGKYGLMFYNAIFMLVPLVIFAHLNGEFEKVSILVCITFTVHRSCAIFCTDLTNFLRRMRIRTGTACTSC